MSDCPKPRLKDEGWVCMILNVMPKAEGIHESSTALNLGHIG